MPSKACDFAAVREKELDDIAIRRIQSGVGTNECANSDNAKAEAKRGARNDLAGLALSGGGLRSACFNLGVLQALHRSGVLRFIDYLSTVSGGGYIGSKLTSSVLAQNTNLGRENFPFAEDNAGLRQSPETLRLTYGGNYLFRPWEAFNKYFIGVVLNNTAVLSMIVAVAAVCAMGWRAFDSHWFRNRSALLGLGNDLVAPFIPYLMFSLLWMVAWTVSYFRHQAEAPGTIARYLLYLKAASLLIGITLLIGNGDIGLPEFMRAWIGNEQTSVSPTVWAPVVVMMLLMMLPIIRPSRLLRSGVQPQKPWEKYVFAGTTAALLMGLPLILVGWLSRENISGYSTSAARPMLRYEVRDWPAFCNLILNDPLAPADSMDQGPQKSPIFQLLSPDSNVVPVAVESPKGIRDLLNEVDQLNQQSLNSKSPSKDLPKLSAWLEQGSNAGDLKSTEFFQRYLKASTISATTDHPLTVASHFREKSRAELESTIRLHAAQYLQLVAFGIMAADARQKSLMNQLHDLDADAENFLSLEQQRSGDSTLSQWEANRGDDFFCRLFQVVGWSTSLDRGNAVGDLWKSQQQLDQLQDEFLGVFSLCLLNRVEFGQQIQWWYRHKVSSSMTKAAEAEGVAPRSADHAASTKALEEFQRQARVAFLGHDLPKVVGAHRLALEAIYPNLFHSRSQNPQRRVVIEEDQWHRLKICFVALTTLLIAGFWIDVNATSMHRYYRTRLADAFITRRSDKSEQNHYVLSELRTTDFGAPYHLLLGSVSLSSTPDIQTCDKAIPILPRTVDSFLFSRRFCGSEITGFENTSDFEARIRGNGNRVDLAESMAISGAALSPLQTPNLLIRFLMFAMNLRLGQWLPTPGRNSPAMRPRILYLLYNLLKSPVKRPYCFVTDGGHSENLGVIELLKRRCALIIASDVSQDEQHAFADLARALRLARTHYGIRIVDWNDMNVELDRELDVTPLRRSIDKPSGFAASENGKESETSPEAQSTADHCQVTRHFLVGRIIYPVTGAEIPDQNEYGLFIYLKPSITGDEGLELHQYQQTHSAFPHESTVDQMFDPSQVEAYRNLGDHIASDVCRYFIMQNAERGKGNDLWSEECRHRSVKDICENFQQTLKAQTQEEQAHGTKSPVKAKQRESAPNVAK